MKRKLVLSLLIGISFVNVSGCSILLSNKTDYLQESNPEIDLSSDDYETVTKTEDKKDITEDIEKSAEEIEKERKKQEKEKKKREELQKELDEAMAKEQQNPSITPSRSNEPSGEIKSGSDSPSNKPSTKKYETDEYEASDEYRIIQECKNTITSNFGKLETFTLSTNGVEHLKILKSLDDLTFYAIMDSRGDTSGMSVHFRAQESLTKIDKFLDYIKEDADSLFNENTKCPKTAVELAYLYKVYHAYFLNNTYNGKVFTRLNGSETDIQGNDMVNIFYNTDAVLYYYCKKCNIPVKRVFFGDNYSGIPMVQVDDILGYNQGYTKIGFDAGMVIDNLPEGLETIPVDTDYPENYTNEKGFGDLGKRFLTDAELKERNLLRVKRVFKPYSSDVNDDLGLEGTRFNYNGYELYKLVEKS
jgi:hypothetical protein